MLHTSEIKGRITEITPNFVKADCVVDEREPVFEERRFPDYLFNFPIEVGDYVTFEIQWEPGKQTISIVPAEDPDTELFDLAPGLDASGEAFSEAIRI